MPGHVKSPDCKLRCWQGECVTFLNPSMVSIITFESQIQTAAGVTLLRGRVSQYSIY